MNPTLLLTALLIVIASITLLVAWYVFDPFGGRREKKRKAQHLANIAERLEKGMTLDEIEDRYGYFNHYELPNPPKSNTQICYIGKDRSPYISLVFINNVLNEWRLVA